MEARNTRFEPDAAARVFLLIDGQPIYHRGVQSIVAREPALLCVGDAGSCEAALEQAPALRPDVVLADAELVLGPQAASLQQRLPGARFVVLVDDIDGRPAEPAVGLDRAAVLPKSASARELLDALMHADVAPPAPAPAAPVAGRGRRSGGRLPGAVGSDLTRRERDLLALMAKGLGNADISQTLCIAMPTVKFHVANIMSKLDADNRTSAVLVALRHKLVALE
jgi:two-component system, NarL family, response regulator LiaR